MSNTAEALAALKTAEAELEAALAAEKAAAPESGTAADEPVSTPVAVAPVPLRTDGPTLDEYVKAGYLAENYPPAGYAARVAPVELPKWAELPNHLGPIAVNGT